MSRDEDCITPTVPRPLPAFQALLSSAGSNCERQELLAGKCSVWQHENMRVRFYIDPESQQPHIYGHDVSEAEVEEVLRSPGEDRPGVESARVAIGQTHAGRYLRIIYVPDPEPESVFVITAYELRGKPLTAYRRRRKKN